MNLGGVEKGVVDLAYHFKNDLVVISGGGRLVEELKKAGAVHYRLPVYAKSPLSILLIPRLRRIIKKEGIDIVHARSRVPAWISFFANRGLNSQFITTAHGLYARHIFSEVMGWGKFVICPSKVIARHMMDYFGVPQEKIRIISRWVDLSAFLYGDPATRKYSQTVVSIGRISPSKGFEYLIHAFRKVVRNKPYLTLHIIGEAEPSKVKYLNYLKSLVTRFSLDYNIKFLGYRQDIQKVMKDASVVVIPSVIKEAFGRVAVEAFASGVPVIATKVGALEEIIKHREDGILVAPRSPEELAHAILEIVDTPALAKKLATNARKKVEVHYSFTQCVSALEDVYLKALTQKRILVLKISSLGDLILSIPALKALKENVPHSTITLITLKEYAPLFYECPYLDEVIAIEATYKKIRTLLKIGLEVRRRSFDYIIDLQNNFASHCIAFLGLYQKSFGYSRKLGFLLTHRVKYTKETMSPLDSQEKVLNLLGVRLKEKKLIFWDIDNRSVLEKFGLHTSDTLIGINVSASLRWKTKNWPHTHIKKLIEIIAKDLPGAKVILVGDRHSTDDADLIQSASKKNVINLCGRTTLKELAYLLRAFDVFVTQDTASLHLALSVGVSTVALFGPTDPARHVVGADTLHTMVKHLPCSFCYKPRCPSRRCMDEITPQEVFAKIAQCIKR